MEVSNKNFFVFIDVFIFNIYVMVVMFDFIIRKYSCIVILFGIFYCFLLILIWKKSNLSVFLIVYVEFIIVLIR